MYDGSSGAMETKYSINNIYIISTNPDSRALLSSLSSTE